MCTVCEAYEARGAAGIVSPDHGAVAQLVERVHGMDEVARSIRVGSTFFQMLDLIGAALGGLVAGEGSFIITRRNTNFVRDGSPRLRFLFQFTMADRDRALVMALRDLLGVGSVRSAKPGKPGHSPTTVLTIASERAHIASTIPFAERYLPEFTAKHQQFVAWRDQLFDYRIRRPSQYERGRSTCKIEGCDKPVRGRGLCRSHYYRVTGY